ncbi:MAG: hypothetical protein ACOX4A_07640 [Saccharofermentanales bacterium]|jgi:hypothetical protein
MALKNITFMAGSGCPDFRNKKKRSNLIEIEQNSLELIDFGREDLDFQRSFRVK